MDFHARQYDPQLGRFLGIDPLAYSGGQQVFSPYAAMGNSPGMMIDPNGEMTKYADDPDAAMNDWLVNSPERRAWLLGRNPTGKTGAAGNMLGLNMGGDMFMWSGAGGGGRGGKNYRPSFADMLEDAIGIAERAKGEMVSFQLDDFGLTGAYWLNGNSTDLYQDDEFLPPIKMVSAIGGGWFATNLDDVTNAVQSRLIGGGQQSNGGDNDNGGFSPWGPILIGLGQPLDFLKPVGAAGSQRGSSIASWGLDKILNKASKATGKNLSHFPKQAFTGWKLKTGTEFGLRRTATTSVGKFAGRWVPILGWGIFAYDIYDNREAIGEWVDEQQRINEANKNTPYWNICFEKGTLIYGSNGLVPIENINVGDSVYSYNLQTNTTELSKVANTFRRETGAIYELTFNNEIVYVTAEHPFYVIGKGWVKVKDLKAGDELQSSVKEKSVKITSVILQERSVMVYNIEVDTNHNYFVSDDKILVHNKSIEDFEEEPVYEEENENIIDKH